MPPTCGGIRQRVLVLGRLVENDRATVSSGGERQSQALSFSLGEFKGVRFERPVQTEDFGERARRMAPFHRRFQFLSNGPREKWSEAFCRRDPPAP